MNDIFYTILCDRKGYPVRYINRQTCHTGYFTGPFGDPGEASQEFQASVGNTTECHYLAEQQWQATAYALIQQHRQALAAWHRWLALSKGQETQPERRP
jgi:hypothetical protein